MVVVLRPVGEVAGQADELVRELQIEIDQLAPGTIIEHVGATALPAGVTKGGVDVSVAVPAEDFEALVRTLERRYEVAQPQNWTDTYVSFAVLGRRLGDRPVRLSNSDGRVLSSWAKSPAVLRTSTISRTRCNVQRRVPVRLHRG